MRNFILLLFLLVIGISDNLLGQNLPVVSSVGGDSTNVNWLVIKAEEEAEEDGPGFFYHDCAQGVKPVKVSSTLAGQGAKSYGMTNLSDDDPMTAWVEGVKGYGIGEWFEVEAAGVNTIYNGYQSSPLNWKNNSRVKRFKVYVDGTALCFLDLTDEMGRQSFDLDVEYASYENPKKFRFEIVDVYKGDKWDDVAISHVDQFGCCFAANTHLMAMAGSFVEAGVMQNGSQILAFDMVADSVYTSTVERKAAQRHVTMLRITAGGNRIEVTPDHPLYVKDRGFVSMNKLRAETPGKSYGEIIGKYELMMWNADKGISYFSQIDSIEVLTGDFQTVTVRQLSNGTMYIANGFVSKTY